jgi:hypothetical protein
VRATPVVSIVQRLTTTHSVLRLRAELQKLLDSQASRLTEPKRQATYLATHYEDLLKLVRVCLACCPGRVCVSRLADAVRRPDLRVIRDVRRSWLTGGRRRGERPDACCTMHAVSPTLERTLDPDHLCALVLTSTVIRSTRLPRCRRPTASRGSRRSARCVAASQR